MGIDEVVVAFELDLDKLIKGARNQENYREFSQYPAVEHDLAIVVDNAVTCEDLERRITSAGGKLPHAHQRRGRKSAPEDRHQGVQGRKRRGPRLGPALGYGSAVAAAESYVTAMPGIRHR